MDIYLEFPVMFQYKGTDMGFIFLKPYHILIFAALMRFCRSADIGRFQNVCFSLRVIPKQDIRSVRKFNKQILIIAEIFELNGFYHHCDI